MGNLSHITRYDLTARFNDRRILTLCSYALAQCNDQQMSKVMHADHYAVERLEADWRASSCDLLNRLWGATDGGADA